VRHYEHNATASSNGTLPTIGTLNRNFAATRIKKNLHIADHDIRHDFADDDLDRAQRRGKQVLHVPLSRSRVMASAVMMIIVIVKITPMSPGTMLYWVMFSGL